MSGTPDWRQWLLYLSLVSAVGVLPASGWFVTRVSEEAVLTVASTFIFLLLLCSALAVLRDREGKPLDAPMPTRFLFVTLFSGLALGPIVGPIVTDNRLALLDTMLGVWAVTLLIVAAVRERQLRPPVYPSALWPVALLVGGGVAYVFGGLWHTAACVLLVLGVLLWPAAVRPVASRVASAGRP